MRLRSRSLLILLVLTLFFSSPTFGSEEVLVNIEAAEGLYTITFETAHGKIKVNLPDDMAPGDTISGTVIAEPIGKTEREQRRNTAELSKYVIEVEKKRTPVIKEFFKWTIPVTLTDGLYLILEDKKGKKVGEIEVPVIPTPLVIDRPPTPTSADYLLPRIGQEGRVAQILGPFDGDSSTTVVKIGGQEARVLAESPRKTVFESPRDIVGSTEIELKEGDAVANGRFSNLRVTFISPKTTLGKEVKEPEQAPEIVTGERLLAEPNPTPVEQIEKKAELETGKFTEEKTLPPSPTPTPVETTKIKEEEIPLSRPTEELIEVEPKKEELLAEQTPAPLKQVEKKTELEAGKVTEEKTLPPSPTPTPVETTKIKEEQTPLPTKEPIKVETSKKEEAASKDMAAMPATQPAGKYTVQIGSFQKEEEAQEIVESLKSKGYPAFVKTAEIPGKGTWHRVRIGTFETKEEAELYGDNLKSLEPSIKSVLVIYTVKN